MGPQDPSEDVMPFRPPAWMIAQAKKNIANAKVTPEAFAEDLRKAMKNNKDAAELNWSSDSSRERGSGDWSSNRSPEASEIALERATSVQPLDDAAAKEVQHNAQLQTYAASTSSQSKLGDRIGEDQRGGQIQRRDDRRAKKAKIRAIIMQLPVKKSAPSRKEVLPSPVIAGSSSAGAVLEHTTEIRSPTTSLSLQSLFVSEKSAYPVQSVLPKWCTSISPTSLDMKQLERKRPPSYTALEVLKDCIRRCGVEKKPSQLNALFEELRNHVHKAEIKLDVTPHILKKARILTLENGLPRIFNEEAGFPPDLKADAYQLYKRWYEGNFTQNILRGIILVKGKDRNNDRLEPEYSKKHPSDPKVYGSNGLVLGQWWPTQLCTVRDGAHGATQGGIFGAREKGAYSIVLSGGSYHDKDDGDKIEYSGTEGKNSTPTENTNHMILSKELGNAIRVIRSHQLEKSNKYRPEVGLRYDGLYVVTDYTLINKEKAMYRFHLVRCAGQEPIRCEDNAARRPTIFEVQEWMRLREEKRWL